MLLRVGGYAVTCRSKISATGTVVVEKEKRLVLLNRPAKSASEIVLPQGRPGLAIVIAEPTVGIELVIAQEFVEAAVELICPRAGHEVHDGRARKAVFGAEIGLLNLELFDRFHGGNVRLRQNAAILLKVRGTHAIHQYVGSGIAAAVRDEVGSGTGFATVIGNRDSRREIRQIEDRTVNQGQVVNQISIHYLTRDRILGLQLGATRLDIHHLPGSADFHGEVDGGVLVDIHLNAFLPLVLEIGCLHRDAVAARRDWAE